MSLFGSIAKRIQDQSVVLRLAGAARTANATDATLNVAQIATGLDEIDSFSVFVLRAGVNVTADAAITLSGGNILVADGAATYVVTDGDVLWWMALGR